MNTDPDTAQRIETAKLLQKLSTSPVGLKEAAVLFAITGDTSYLDLTVTLGITNRTAWSRISVLKAKGFVETRHHQHGGIYHVLTREGKKVVGKTLDTFV